MKIFNRYYSTYDLALIFGDLAVLVTGTVALRFVTHLTGLEEVADWVLWLIQGTVIAVLTVAAFYYSDLYAIDQTLSDRELRLRLTNGFSIACLMMGAVTYLVPELQFRQIYLGEIMLLGIGLFAWRVAYMRVLMKARIWAKVLIIGEQEIGKRVAEELCRQKHLGMEVVGFVGSRAGELTLSYGNPRRLSLPVFPSHSTISVVENKGVNRVLLTRADSCSDFPAMEPVILRLRGIPVEDCHTFYERLTSKISIADLQPGWIVLSEGFRRTRWIQLTKRVTDILVSTLGLILTSPITLLTAVAIKLDSPGPVFYRQERVGQNERPFILYKFRSMVSEAEALSGPVWAQANDSRMTRVGKLIRKLRIDELPQMINVLNGEMSFVGPRPERPIFVSRLKEKIPYYHMRFSVKPGITGWAQILAPYGDSEEGAIEKLQYELYYLKNISPVLDLQIIFETLKVVLLGKGAH